MSKLLTDEILAKAKAAQQKAMKECDERNEICMNDHLDAALTAVLPDIIEECAKVAESFACCGCDGRHGACSVDDPPKAIAAAIRLLGKEG